MKCVVKARMRLDGVWSDVCIRNISSRGMLVQAALAPPRGTYLVIHRGRHVVVARVAWSKDYRFGLQTQDPLNIEAVLKEPDRSSINYKEAVQAQPNFERRSAARASDENLRWKAEQNRFAGKFLEFACIGALAATLGWGLFETVSETLSRSVAGISAHL